VLIDLRTYTIAPGKTQDYLTLYERHAKDVQFSHLGRPIGYFTSEVGPLNEAIHIWAYEDWQDRADRRAAMWADPRFAKATESLYPLITAQSNKLLTPASFSPLK
jgi:NIPSNAP